MCFIINRLARYACRRLLVSAPAIASPTAFFAQYVFFKGIRHCFHSAREVGGTKQRGTATLAQLFALDVFKSHGLHVFLQVAATFGIPLVRTDVTKRKREEEEEEDVPNSEPRFPDGMGLLGSGGSGAGGMMTMSKSDAKKKMKEATKKGGRTGSRFQNQKLVKSINVSEQGSLAWLLWRNASVPAQSVTPPSMLPPLQSHVGMEVVCGNLRARLVSSNLGGMTFELLDDYGKVMTHGAMHAPLTIHPATVSNQCFPPFLHAAHWRHGTA